MKQYNLTNKWNSWDFSLSLYVRRKSFRLKQQPEAEYFTRSCTNRSNVNAKDGNSDGFMVAFQSKWPAFVWHFADLADQKSPATGRLAIERWIFLHSPPLPSPRWNDPPEIPRKYPKYLGKPEIPGKPEIFELRNIFEFWRVPSVSSFPIYFLEFSHVLNTNNFSCCKSPL